jgi:hypothetical protein
VNIFFRYFLDIAKISVSIYSNFNTLFLNNNYEVFMRLEDKINDPSLNGTDLRKILEKVSNISVNWTGSRVVSIQDYEGFVSLDDIAKKALDISQQKGLQRQEKDDIMTCEAALTRCYEMADAVWQESNPITLSIGYVSRVIFEGYGNSFSPNFNSIKWRILDHEISNNLEKNNK